MCLSVRICMRVMCTLEEGCEMMGGVLLSGRLKKFCGGKSVEGRWSRYQPTDVGDTLKSWEQIRQLPNRRRKCLGRVGGWIWIRRGTGVWGTVCICSLDV